MSLLKKLFGVGRNPTSYAARLEKAKALHGQPVKYVTERRNDNEDVIGRGGALAVHGDTLIHGLAIKVKFFAEGLHNELLKVLREENKAVFIRKNHHILLALTLTGGIPSQG